MKYFLICNLNLEDMSEKDKDIKSGAKDENVVAKPDDAKKAEQTDAAPAAVAKKAPRSKE